ncbi:MAG: gliding motility-associated C-terminal domain-containing protein, partial [Bacteroidales bacterium]|nr:gliding motility-associated C-terminal domain-containing protein [Bacteroidales bacterium]
FYVQYSDDIISFNIIIFNRWGEKVFVSDNINEKWDGKYKGNKCAESVYYWVIEYYCTGLNKELSLKGSVTLLR